MKELSIEEKAKAYDEALERAKQFHDKELFAECNGRLVEYIFPELKAPDSAAYAEAYIIGAEHTIKTISDVIDTLEVKEVDLDKEIDKWWWGRTWQTYGMALNPDNIRDFAKYFVELGLKAQRKSISISNIDNVLKELGVDPYSKEAKMIKESYYAAIDKLLAQKGE